MSAYIITQVITYKPANKKAEDAASFATQLKHRIITGKHPVTDLLRAIEDHCRFLDHKHRNTRKLKVELERASVNNEMSLITIYNNYTVGAPQPKAAVIYVAQVAGVINMDETEAGTIDFGQEVTEVLDKMTRKEDNHE